MSKYALSVLEKKKKLDFVKISRVIVKQTSKIATDYTHRKASEPISDPIVPVTKKKKKVGLRM